jgi:hypothetical protein
MTEPMLPVVCQIFEDSQLRNLEACALLPLSELDSFIRVQHSLGKSVVINATWVSPAEPRTLQTIIENSLLPNTN